MFAIPTTTGTAVETWPTVVVIVTSARTTGAASPWHPFNEPRARLPEPGPGDLPRLARLRRLRRTRNLGPPLTRVPSVVTPWCARQPPALLLAHRDPLREHRARGVRRQPRRSHLRRAEK